MKLDLSEIAAEVGKKIAYKINEPPFFGIDDGIVNTEKISGEIKFSNASAVIVVRGKFETVLELTCSRCLEAYTQKLSVPISEELPLAKRAPDGSEDDFEELPEDEKDPLFENNIFDLSMLLEESDNLPTYPADRQINSLRHLDKYGISNKINKKYIRKLIDITEMPIMSHVNEKIMTLLFSGIGIYKYNAPELDQKYSDDVITKTLNGSVAFTMANKELIYGLNSSADNIIIDDLTPDYSILDKIGYKYHIFWLS